MSETILLGRDSVENSLAHYGRKGMKWHKNVFTGEKFMWSPNEASAAEALGSAESDNWINGIKSFLGDKSAKQTNDNEETNFTKNLIATGADLVTQLLGGKSTDIKIGSYGAKRYASGRTRVSKK